MQLRVTRPSGRQRFPRGSLPFFLSVQRGYRASTARFRAVDTLIAARIATTISDTRATREFAHEKWAWSRRRI